MFVAKLSAVHDRYGFVALTNSLALSFELKTRIAKSGCATKYIHGM
jgi:hypothetical protein